MYPTNSEVRFVNDIKFTEMRNITLLTASALLLTAAAAMFLTGVNDPSLVIGSSLVVLVGTAAALLLTFSTAEVYSTLYATVTRGIQRDSTPTEMITMIAMLSDLSRRVGLVGLVDIRTSSKELHEVCRLLASAADEMTIRMHLHKRRDAELTTHKMFFSVMIFALIYALVIGLLTSVIHYMNAVQSNEVESVSVIVSMLPAVCGITLAFLISILMGRMNIAHLREMVSLEIAYQGGAMILEDNNAENVHLRLTSLLPPGMK